MTRDTVPALLYRTLMESPSLRKLCRILRLSLSFYHADDKEIDGISQVFRMEGVVRNMFTWLCNITKLDICYTDDPGYEGILAAVSQNLSSLQHVQKLTISGRDDYIIRPDLYHGISRKLPSLQSVAVEEAGCRQGYGRVDYARDFPPFKAKVPPPSLSSITFHGGFADDPPNLIWFLRQPLQLTSFTFELIYRDRHDFNKEWSLHTIFSALYHQARTLRTLDISILHTGTNGALEEVDLSYFTSLEELTLPYWNIGQFVGDWTSHCPMRKAHAAILSPPKLRKLTLDFEAIQEMGGPSLDSFGDLEEEWLSGLVLTAAREKKPLRCVHLGYKPRRLRRKRKGVDIWPWARLNWIQDLEEVRRAGIDISYGTPVITEEEFDALEVNDTIWYY